MQRCDSNKDIRVADHISDIIANVCNYCLLILFRHVCLLITCTIIIVGASHRRVLRVVVVAAAVGGGGNDGGGPVVDEVAGGGRADLLGLAPGAGRMGGLEEATEGRRST